MTRSSERIAPPTETQAPRIERETRSQAAPEVPRRTVPQAETQAPRIERETRSQAAPEVIVSFPQEALPPPQLQNEEPAEPSTTSDENPPASPLGLNPRILRRTPRGRVFSRPANVINKKWQETPKSGELPNRPIVKTGKPATKWENVGGVWTRVPEVDKS